MSASWDADAPTAAGRWLIAITVMFGTFMAVMDTSVVNVSMPHMMGSFGQDLTTITWVATSYSIAEIIMITMAAWWSSLIGRKNLYLISFSVFLLGSVLCGTATSFTQMIVYRVIQGIGGGALIPVSLAILRETFPVEQQGMAMSVYGMGVVLAPAIGPTLGGWLTDAYGWPMVFYINVPVCLAGMLMVVNYVNDPSWLRRGVKYIDFPGIILLAVTLTGMQVVLERGQEKNWFESQQVVLFTVLTFLALAALIVRELRTPEPVVNLRILKNRNLVLGSVLGLVFGIALFGTTFILPQFTQKLLGYPAFQAGLILAPRALTLLLAMPVAGRLYRLWGPRALAIVGTVIIMWAYYDLSRLSLDAGFASLVPTLLIMGLGMPFMFVPLSAVSLSTVEKRNMTDASSMYTLARRVGGNVGYALAATLVSRGTQIHRSFLAAHVSAGDQITQAYTSALSSALHHLGVTAVNAPVVALAVVNREIDRQASMLAYNDVSLIFGLLFLLTLPLVFLLPGRLTALRRVGAGS